MKFMTKKCFGGTAGTISAAGAALGLVTLGSSLSAQTYTPDNWVVDPYSPNANFTVSGATSTSPTYTDNGSATGSLYGYSSLGATLSLVNIGDNITYSGQFSLAGNVNNSNLQFRFGLLYAGSSANDTGWLGYDIGLPNAAGQPGLYERNNPNTGVFASGTGATTVSSGDTAFTGPLAAGTYDFSLSVTLSSSTSETINWSVTGINSNPYIYTGSYVNTTLTTEGSLNFDSVGFLGGGSTFASASTSDVISFGNPTVTLVPEPSVLALAGVGLTVLLGRYRRSRPSAGR